MTNHKIINIAILSILFIILCGCSQKNNVADNAIEKGYDVEQISTSEFYITENNVRYYFKSGLLSTHFDHLELEVEPTLDYEIIDNIGTVIIKQLSNDQVEVTVKDECVTDSKGDEKITFKESISVTCGRDFSEESIDSNTGNSILGKSDKYYHKITTYFASQEELCELYENAMEIWDDIQ